VIRHVSLLTFVDEATDADVRDIERALAELPARLPQLRAYRFGRDLGIDAGNSTFAVVADVDTIEDYVAYRDDPEHQRILAELIRPLLASRAAVQYEVDA
jgi:hypothetical protein